MATKKSTKGFLANRKQHDIARALGWFSIALGTAQLLAPRRVGRAIGAGDHRFLMRLLGLREVASGIGILTRAQPAPWFKARLAGDLMDLTLLGAALLSPTARVGRLALASAAVAGVARLDSRTSEEFRREPGVNFTAVHVTRSVTIDRSPQELFDFWRDFENLPQFMSHLRSVRVIDEKRSHWVAKGPAGVAAEWDAEIVNEHPGELISWRSLPGSKVDNAGTIRFNRAPGDRGTFVKLELQYQPPAGVLGETIARAFGKSPGKEVAVDLHRFKQLMETGEIARTRGQPAGRKHSLSQKFDEPVRA